MLKQCSNACHASQLQSATHAWATKHQGVCRNMFLQNGQIVHAGATMARCAALCGARTTRGWPAQARTAPCTSGRSQASSASARLSSRCDAKSYWQVFIWQWISAVPLTRATPTASKAGFRRERKTVIKVWCKSIRFHRCTYSEQPLKLGNRPRDRRIDTFGPADLTLLASHDVAMSSMQKSQHGMTS